MKRLPVWPWKLFHAGSMPRSVQVEVWVASDIVSNISSTHPALSNDVLVNPANKLLSGTAYPYFPVGGPLPKGELGRHSVWGGMDAGDAMCYPAQCVDGRVHMEGGSELKQLLRDRTCPVGEAVVTRAVGDLSACGYKYIIHTVPPLASDAFQTPMPNPMPNIDSLLTSCYLSSLALACTLDIHTLASPLIGAGTAGFSTQRCAAALREALHPPRLEPTNPNPITLRLVLQRTEDAELVSELLFGKEER
ncbi:hypothetical protein B484DRAFT_453238 [Ochromonadaceae sp. CCMP2298]|nr:hypothetical protein B484DRAFT_453238 [Ochromonadaceae sp. CCMP2298]|mmetsp:Transcript_33332/g.73442  ORF Transcript_33332/g.73442 Transcript_33332/m.73442 type:complete len:249 (-) Transcript_33332:127-873(-)